VVDVRDDGDVPEIVSVGRELGLWH
jgi:hypothetical protein